MNVNDGIVQVIGELRILVNQKDIQIEKLVRDKEILSAEISKTSSNLHEVLDANKRLAETIRIFEAKAIGDKECQPTSCSQP